MNAYDEKLAVLVSELARILNLETLDIDKTLGEVGVDSLAVVEFTLVVEELYSIQIDYEELEISEAMTIREIIAAMTRARRSEAKSLDER